MIIWTDELCGRVKTLLDGGDVTYKMVASQLSAELGESIHYEQVRGAMRRYNDRAPRPQINTVKSGATPAVVDEFPRFDPNRKRAIPALMTGDHKPRKFKPQRIRFGAMGDTHLCSNYADLESLHKLYDIYEQEGVEHVYHTGNMIDGEARFNTTDIHVHGMTAQVKYFVDNYPKRDGIMTHYVSGDDHEGWYQQNTGIDIGQYIEDQARRAGRSDLRYLEYMECSVPLTLPNGETLSIYVMHPGGGSNAAISGTSQKIVDAWETYERPFLLLTGHYHKAEYLPNYRGVRIVQTGSFQTQTPFMRKKRLHSDVGGWIIDISVVDENTTRVSAEFINFSPKPWKYQLGM